MSHAVNFLRERYINTPENIIRDYNTAANLYKKWQDIRTYFGQSPVSSSVPVQSAMAFTRRRMPYRRAGFNKRKTFRKKPMRRRYYRKPKRTFRRRRTTRGRRFSVIPALSMKGFRNVTLTYKCITEVTFKWHLVKNATATLPIFLRIGDFWLPGEGVCDEADKTWDKYHDKKLRHLSWKMDNFRIFKDDYKYFNALTTPFAVPAVQTATTNELPRYRFWYRRVQDRASEVLKPNEEQMTVFNKYNTQSKIWGKQRYHANGIYADPVSITATQLHAYTYDTFSKKFLSHPLRDDGATLEDKTLGIFIMADDPLPPSLLDDGTRQCDLNVVADLTVYTTFSVWDRNRDLSAVRGKVHLCDAD